MSSNSASGRGCFGWASTLALTTLLIAPSLAFAQRDRDRDRDRDRGVTQLDPGMAITVRTTEPIDSRRSNERVYTAVVDRDVWGENHRLVIPRGATAELVVRHGRRDALILDLASIDVRGQRYGVSTDPTRVRGTSGRDDDDIVGSIIGSITGVRGDEVRIPRDSEITFRLDQPLVVDVPDRGRFRDRDRDYNDHDHDGDRDDHDRDDRH